MPQNIGHIYWEPGPDWWQRGDIPRDIESIFLGLLSQPNSHANHVAVSDVAKVVHMVIQRAFAGDPECGSLLGELLAFLWKKRSDLSVANWHFERQFLKFESARPATRKRSALRRLIQRILEEAQQHRLFFLLTGSLSPDVIGINPEDLRGLPELGPSDEAINAWTNVIVYPHLKRMAHELRDDPEIGRLKKALDENGKFHILRLKPLIRQTVGRIASVPQAHYFDIS